MFDNNRLGEIRPNQLICCKGFGYRSGPELLEGKRKENHRWSIGCLFGR